MPTVNCPINGRPYATPDIDAILAVALINTHTTTYVAATNTAITKAEKVKHPSISSGGTNKEWKYFTSRWADFIEATKVSGKDKVIQHLERCDEQFCRDIIHTAVGTITYKTEDKVLNSIKHLAIHEENIMVTRVKLQICTRTMMNAPIHAFGACLRGQAATCGFTIKCPNCNHNVDYTEPMIRDSITKGLQDSHIKLDLLGDTDQTKTLESTLKFVEAKETGKWSAEKPLVSQLYNAAAASSSYCRSLNKSRNDHSTGQPKSKNKTDVCFYCSKTCHGRRLPAKIRKWECPPFGHKCTICSKLNHYNQVCHQKHRIITQAPGIPPDEHEGVVFDSLCRVTATNPSCRKPLTLDHHIYNHLSDTWTRQPSQAQPLHLPQSWN